jgi:hypothetical protein
MYPVENTLAWIQKEMDMRPRNKSSTKQGIKPSNASLSDGVLSINLDAGPDILGHRGA